MKTPSKRIRVCHIVTRLAVRGVPRQVLDIAEGLDPARFDVEVLTGHSEPDEGDLWEEACERGIRVTRIESLCRPVRLSSDVRALYQIYRHLRAHPCDLVHTHIAKAGLLGRLAARFAGIPRVVHTYHGIPNEWVGHGTSARFFRAVERSISTQTDAIVAVSRAVQDLVQAIPIGRGNSWHVIYNGIDRSFVDAEPAERQATQLLVVGSLTREKGCDVLLHAMPKIISHWPSVELLFLGDGPLKKQLEALACQLGIADHVRFLGLVADVRLWLRTCTILVAPSRSEGLGMAVIEAMAMGCPVVASRTGGLTEVVSDGETGYLVDVGHVEGLVDRIANLLQDPDQRAHFGAAGRARAYTHFAADRSIAQLEDVYTALIEKPILR